MSSFPYPLKGINCMCISFPKVYIVERFSIGMMMSRALLRVYVSILDLISLSGRMVIALFCSCHHCL